VPLLCVLSEVDDESVIVLVVAVEASEASVVAFVESLELESLALSESAVLESLLLSVVEASPDELEVGIVSVSASVSIPEASPFSALESTPSSRVESFHLSNSETASAGKSKAGFGA
jgi:hypothetical protein